MGREKGEVRQRDWSSMKGNKDKYIEIVSHVKTFLVQSW